jgi:DHA1 family multidrug resistance protein-like MFS transporter
MSTDLTGYQFRDRIDGSGSQELSTTIGDFVKRFGGVGSVAFLTYFGEYMSFIVLLAFISQKLTVDFGLGLFGYAFIGTLSGLYLVLSGLIAIPIGHYCDLYGRKRFTVIGSVLGAIALLLMILFDRSNQLNIFLAGIGISLGALGIGHGTYTASTLAYTGDVSDHDNYGKPYGLVELAELAGYAFGPGVGGLTAFLFGRAQTFAISAILLLLAALMALFFMPEQKRTRSLTDSHSQLGSSSPEHYSRNDDDSSSLKTLGWPGFLSIFKHPIIGVTLLTTFLGSVAFSGFFYYIPLFAFELRNMIPILGNIYPLFASVMAATAVIIMIPFGHIGDKTKRRMLFLASGMILGSISLFYAFSYPNLPSFLLSSVAFGVSVAVVRISQLVILAERSSVLNRAAVMGTNHAVEHAGYGVGALIGGIVVAFLGFVSTFEDISVLLLLSGLGVYAYARIKKLR